MVASSVESRTGAAVVVHGEEVMEKMVDRRRRVGNCMIAIVSGRVDAGDRSLARGWWKAGRKSKGVSLEFILLQVAWVSIPCLWGNGVA